MTTETDRLEHKLDQHRKLCDLAGCREGLVQKKDLTDCQAKMTKCIENIKSTMQKKSHVLWELGKIILIPGLTALAIYYSSFVRLETEFKYFKAIVLKQLNIEMP